jgi:DNA invertase Pin-like site-specific DNA recombinase
MTVSTSNSTDPRELGIVLTRVSDPKQSGASSQLTGCRRLAKLLGVEVVAEIDDDGVSGDDLEREGIVETFALLEKEHKAGRPIRWLIVDKTDRLSRADSLDTAAVYARMRRLGARFIGTPGRNYDLYNSLDRTLLGIESDHKNNQNLKDIGRTVLNGMLDSARQGFWTGQKPPFGYKVVRAPGDHAGRKRRSGRLVIDEETAPFVRELFRHYLDGQSVRDLVAWMRTRTGRRWSRTGIESMLHNETYTGVKSFGRRARGKHARLRDGAAEVLTEGAYKGDVIKISAFPAVIDPETFALVQARLKAGRRRSHKKNNTVQPLSGLCRCGACGTQMHCASKHGHAYVICKNRKEADYECCPTSNHARADEVLRRTLAVLSERLLDGDAVARLVELAGAAEDEAREAWEADLDAARRAFDAAERKLATARRRLAEAPDELLEEYQRLVLELKQEKAASEAELARLRAAPPVPEEGDSELLKRWLAACRDVCQGGSLADADGPTQNAILTELLARVTVHPPRRQPLDDAPLRKRRRFRGAATVGRVEVELPEWLCRVLAGTAGCG